MKKLLKIMLFLSVLTLLNIPVSAGVTDIGYVNKQTKTTKVTLAKLDQVELLKVSGKNAKVKVYHNMDYYTVTIPYKNITFYTKSKTCWLCTSSWKESNIVLRNVKGKQILKLKDLTKATIVKGVGKKLYVKVVKNGKTYYGYVDGFNTTIRNPKYLVWD